MKHLYERVKALSIALKSWTIVKETAITDIVHKQCGYKTDNTLPKVEEMTPFHGIWGGKRDDHYWFRFEVETEDLPDCDIKIEAKTQKEGWDLTNPQFIVYVDGEIVQGMDTNHCAFPISGGKHEVYLYAYTGTNVDDLLQLSVKIKYVNRYAERLYYDLFVPMDALRVMKANSKEYADTLLMLNEAYKKLDFITPRTPEFYSACKSASEWFEKKYYQGYCGKERTALSCVGQSHIDVAWLWAIPQTREKVQRSFATVLSLMDRFPEYIYMQSQPYLYEMLKEEAPTLYERLKQRVQEGRWEAEGGMFVEADCNMSSGESLVRQILLGKKFYKDEFNKETEILWLPDSFGFPATLPQIMKKAGLKALVTNKLSWNDTDVMPYDVFDWKGIDDTSVFTYFLTAKESTTQEGFTSCNAEVTAPYLTGTYERLQQKECSDEAIFAYGYGDGGGGPSEEFLQQLRRYSHGLPEVPFAKHDTLKNALLRVEKKARKSKRLPKWKGELYFQFHRGVYTSIANNKKNNRKAEILLHNIELYSTLANQLLGSELPEKWLKSAWKTVAINQFHDILPGTSVTLAHKQSEEQYNKLFVEGNALLNGYLSALAKNCGEYTVFNPNGFTTDGYVVENGKYKFVKNIPAFGFASVDFEESKKTVKVKTDALENTYYRLKFGKDGAIVSIFDKQAKREILKDSARLTAYEDRPQLFDSAEIRKFYKEKEYSPVLLEVQDIELGEKVGKRFTFKLENSLIVEDVCLYANSRRIDFDVKLDWKEEHSLLRALFPVDLNANSANCDIQFGRVERPTIENTSWQSAQFEFCAHKYVDISEGNYGVALMNDCKYGHSVTDNVLGLSLLRCHSLSSNYYDKGEHEMHYALYPHTGGLKDSDVVKESYLVNNPLLLVKGDGVEKNAYSFATCENNNVVLETVKPSEDGTGVIVRLYETENCRTKCKLHFANSFKKAYLCDLLENEEKELQRFGNTLTFSVKPFEIITMKIIF